MPAHVQTMLVSRVLQPLWSCSLYRSKPSKDAAHASRSSPHSGLPPATRVPSQCQAAAELKQADSSTPLWTEPQGKQDWSFAERSAVSAPGGPHSWADVPGLMCHLGQV